MKNQSLSIDKYKNSLNLLWLSGIRLIINVKCIFAKIDIKVTIIEEKVTSHVVFLKQLSVWHICLEN